MRSTIFAVVIAASAALLSISAATASATEINDAQRQSNLKTVLEFYEKGLNQKDVEAALALVGPRYTQHNPLAEDGPEGFRKFIALLREKFPKSRSEIKQSFVDGDYVVLHVHSVREPGTRGNAIIDIFKLENGKIVEHWDVVQPIPEKAANTNTMF
ncbi:MULTISPECIES: nuclear transport factor 2 family protein [Rhizobium/Agrobacterium group]|uniref:Nuclear transport factor 2 family protein n=2 Tax=Rhizobium/Agrobacterium group TaxID=227290 RepID=A0A9X3R0F1_9HYPH|nr:MULTISPECIES: nuclear transport factor 2 family protein [Rhizobium/Agrobacterium group]MBO9126263.1 nuclear transport factor 2 family protein [Rhizobium sp. 16-488-2b]MBO9176847.1 nuclear transport factor 2 family protein [Rhizobium sp. 16-488-2a]MBO9197416.1 nuclear transport factor 2 family protein [Rhizobium sp. 16-449-1b]MCZ7466719.1 nuclear transport factor 2 family protein [Rhizobium rhizogenes]MCZ7939247.1 nuclear transport factor 2 family protein [Agrobacterium salinitolerans]